MLSIYDIPVTIKIPGSDLQSFKYKKSHKGLINIFKKYNIQSLYDKIFYTAKILNIEYINSESVNTLTKQDLLFLYKAFDDFKEKENSDREYNNLNNRREKLLEISKKIDSEKRKGMIGGGFL